MKSLIISILSVLVISSATAYGYSGQSCSSSRECSGYREICVREDNYRAGKCSREAVDMDVDAGGSAGSSCTSNYQCSYGLKCIKGQFEYRGVCSN